MLHFVVKNQAFSCPYGKVNFTGSVATHIPSILKCQLLKTEVSYQKREVNFFLFSLQRCMLPPQDSIYVIMTLVWRVWVGIRIKPGPGAVLRNCLNHTWWSRGHPGTTFLSTKKSSTPKMFSNFWALRSKILVLFLFPVINDPLHSATQSRKCCRENAWHLRLVFITSF